MSLEQKTIQGFSWVFVDRFSNKIIQFAFGIILARLLSPKEYGLVGMLAVFLGIANTFIITGFGEALIQKSNPSKVDYSTVFFTNIFTAVVFFGLFFFSAPMVSAFFGEPELEKILIVISLTIIINAFGMVPHIPLLKSMNFEVLAKISVLATFLSGIVAIILAYSDYGVWSLVWRGIIASLVSTVLINWVSRPSFRLVFSRKSFWEFFNFGYKLMVSRILNEVYDNLYYIVIGKYFSAWQLGLYTKANGFKELPSKALYNMINSVSFPALSNIKEDPKRLKIAFKRLVQTTMYITFILLLGLAGVSENFIVGLIGSQWIEAVPFLQLLCFAGIFYPLIHLNMSVWVVNGRSDLYLRMEVIMKAVAIPIIFITIFWGIKAMIGGLILVSAINAFYVLKLTGKVIGYSLFDQARDLLPSLLLAIITGLVVFTLSFIQWPSLLMLLVQCIVGFLVVLVLSDRFDLPPYLEMKKIARKFFVSMRDKISAVRTVEKP